MKIWRLAPPRTFRKFKREITYHWYRLNRIKGSARSVALGFAIGASISMTPFIGLHIIFASLLTVLVRGSLLASIIGTVIFGNPWTFPLIFWLNRYIGNQFVDIATLVPDQQGLLQALLNVLNTVLQAMFGKIEFLEFLTALYDFYIFLIPFMIGSIPMALFTFFFTFYGMEEAIFLYHDRRKRRLKAHMDASEHKEYTETKNIDN